MGRAFSFAEVVTGRDASVPVTDDGLLHAVPYVMVMTGKDRNNAGRDLRDLKDELFHSTKFVERQLSTHGGPKTKLVSFQDAIQLAMVLPGKIAKETRTKFTTIIHRYLAGDHSLIAEIQDNAVSTSPISQLARDSVPEMTSNEVSRKRQLERDDLLFEQELAERRQRLETDRQKQVRLTFENQSAIMDAYTKLCPNQTLDDRARILFKDNMLNLAMQREPSRLAIGNGASEDSRPITISSFALEQGKRYDLAALQKLGIIMSSLYKKRYGTLASKHEQFTDGAVREVRSYSRKDSDLLLEAIRIFESGPCPKKASN